MFEISFTGKKPPEEIIVIERLKELNVLTFNKFNTINIKIVKKVYNINILLVCFIISELFNVKKFVKDFFKLSS